MNPVVLCIMDGVGVRESKDKNAFLQANTPNIDKLKSMYPNSLLEASGELVGIPKGQMGNSEVGHMNIGAGRIVRQPLEIINNSIRTGEFFSKEEFLETIKHVKKNNSKLHLIGLLSDGGIHSHINHLFALLDLAKKENITKVYIHAILDGRDTEKNVALKYLDQLQNKINELGVGVIASISGRYYTMDRDNRWDRTKKGYDVIANAVGPKYNNYKDAIEANYNKNIFDEFVEPSVITNTTIDNKDGIILFNFRSDRLRQLGLALTKKDFNEFEVKNLVNIKMVTFSAVDKEIDSMPVFKNEKIKNDIGEYLSNKGLKQLRIAETEKYPHVTYFFDGGEDLDLEGKDEILIPSPKVATYDLSPEMSAYEITKKALEIMHNYDLIILNYANGDMVGHTGVLEAAIRGVESVDKGIGELYEKIVELKGLLIITADHGNCEDMSGIYEKTHTTNKVPFIVCKENITLKDGKLGDIAPTILTLMNLDIPKEMTGDVLTND